MKSRPKKSGSSRAWQDTVPTGTQRPRKHSPSLSRRKKLSVWHRPLGQVIEEAVLKLAVTAASATLAALAVGSKTKSRALMVIGKTEGQARTSAPATSALIGLGGAMRSASLMCVNWLKPAPLAVVPPAKTPKPIAPRKSAGPNARAPFAPASPAPSPADMARQSMTRPSGVTLTAFMQRLYSDNAKTLFYDPSGMGALWVQSTNGVKNVAGPEAKWYFLAVLKRFEELGEEMSKFNAKYVAMTRSFAEALLEHPATDAIWKQMTSDDPRHVARCFAGLDKPQHLVVDVPASSIHRVTTSTASSVSV